MDLYRPASLEDALRYMSECAASAEKALPAQATRAQMRVRPIAGGTDLLISARQASPEELAGWRVMDISHLTEITGICRDGDCVCIGAAATHTDIERSEAICEAAPLLAEAVRSIGSLQIRNRATLGGNIMNASPAADSLPALAALGAVATLASLRGTREMPIGELVTGPYRTAAAFDELLVGVRFEALEPGEQSAFIKVGRRRALAISRLSAAVAVGFGPGAKVCDIRISAGAAFPAPCRITRAEQAALGKPYSVELAEEAGRAAAEEMVRASGVRWSTEYKKPVLAAIVARAIRQCAAKEGVDVWPE